MKPLTTTTIHGQPLILGTYKLDAELPLVCGGHSSVAHSLGLEEAWPDYPCYTLPLQCPLGDIVTVVQVSAVVKTALASTMG